MACSTPEICDTNNFNLLCSHCMACLEDASLEAALNMGAPDRYFCGVCEQWYDNPAYFEHECIQKAMLKNSTDTLKKAKTVLNDNS